MEIPRRLSASSASETATARILMKRNAASLSMSPKSSPVVSLVELPEPSSFSAITAPAAPAPAPSTSTAASTSLTTLTTTTAATTSASGSAGQDSNNNSSSSSNNDNTGTRSATAGNAAGSSTGTVAAIAAPAIATTTTTTTTTPAAATTPPAGNSKDSSAAKLSTGTEHVGAALPVANESRYIDTAASTENSPSHPDGDKPPGGGSWPQNSLLGQTSNNEFMNNSSMSTNLSSRDLEASAPAASAPMSSPSSAAAAAARPVDEANGVGRPLQQDPAASSTPSTTAAAAAAAASVVEDGDGPRKGGHILRKRARADYTFEHIYEAPIVPISTSSSSSLRGKRRKVGVSDDYDEHHTHTQKRRGVSLGAESHQSPLSRRRHPSRKSLDMRSFIESSEEEQEAIQDTIEVGGVSYPGAHDTDYDEYDPRLDDDDEIQPQHEPDQLPQSPQPEQEQEQPEEQQQQQDEEQQQHQHHHHQEHPQEQQHHHHQDQHHQEQQLQEQQLQDQQLQDQQHQGIPGQNLNTYDDYYEDQPPPVQYSWIEGENPHDSYQIPMDETMADAGVVYPDDDDDDTNLPFDHESSQALLPPQPQPPILEQTREFFQDSPQPLDPALFAEADGVTPKPATPKPDAAEDPPHQLGEDIASAASLEASARIGEAVRENIQEATLSSDSQQPRSEIVADATDNGSPREPPSSSVSREDATEKSPPKSPRKSPSSEAGDEEEDAAPGHVLQVKPGSPTNAQADIVPAEQSPPVVDAPPQTHAAPLTRSARKRQSTKVLQDTVEPSQDLEDQADESANKLSAGKSPSAVPGLELAFNKSHFLKSQPKPAGRWAHLTPYLEGEYVTYPERRDDSEDVTMDDQGGADEKDIDKEAAEPMIEDTEDGDGLAPTPLPLTPRGGSPNPDAADRTTFNSPAAAAAAAADYQDDADASDSEEPQERQKYYSFRKARDPEELLVALQNTEDLDKLELLELIEAANVSMAAWRDEYMELQPLVDDDANAQRRRLADQKYEARTRDLNQHGVNWEEPEFQLKGYQAKKREPMTDNRYLQEQDRTMAAAYGFPYDNHPSKIGKQNPESRSAGGIMTRGRTLRNQPKPTAKATEADEVVGKRQRKPVQPFEALLGNQDISRSSTPVPGTRGRRRRNANPEADALPAPVTTNSGSSIMNKDAASDSEATQPRRRRRNHDRPDPTVVEEQQTSSQAQEEASASQEQASPAKLGRRNRGRNATRLGEVPIPEYKFVQEARQSQPKPPQQRHMITLKVPKGRNVLEPITSSHIVTGLPADPEVRPSTSSSESSSHTAESSYSFRPKRQKRFRDEPESEIPITPQRPRKRAKKNQGPTSAASFEDSTTGALVETVTPETKSKEPEKLRKMHKIKVIRTSAATPVSSGTAPAFESRTGTPASLPTSTGDGDETPKDYRSMTKSEKMSASMKSRWANGNMAGAVEKRKATLAAKKAAQVAAEQKVGPLAPKPKKGKKEKDTPSSASSTTPQPQSNQPPGQHQYHIQPPMMHPPPPHMSSQIHNAEQDMYRPHPHARQHQHQHQHQHPHQHPHQHQHQQQHQYQAQYHQQGFMQQPLPPPVPQHHQHQQAPPPPPPPQPARPPSFMASLPGMGYIYPSK